MEIIFVASNYRTPENQVHVFLDNVVRKMTDLGIKCTVIAPQSWVSRLLRPAKAREPVSLRKTENGNDYTVYSPVYTIFPKKKIGPLHLADLSKKSFYRALKRVYKKYHLSADLVYSHFLQAGIPAVMLAEDLKVPSFIANGEADTIQETACISRSLLKKTLDNVTGIISVSTKNKEELVSLYGNDQILDKIKIIVNAVYQDLFHEKDRKECRKILGFPEDAFIVSYTGSFIPRKGTKLLSAALDRFDDVCSVFAGSGNDAPDCKNILYAGRVDNAELAVYLNAADVFVLPTLAEGCCNAIVEAVACGIPVISSDRPFNYDILDESNSLLIDPTDENAIYEAIRTLKVDTVLRQKLADGCRIKGQELSMDKRVEKILHFIEEKSAEKQSAAI